MEEEHVLAGLAVLERIAIANEQLITLATEERDTGDSIFGPPLCPHCGTFSPHVRNEGGSGPMAEFCLVGNCSNCNKTIYAVPQGWLCFASRDDALQELERRGSSDKRS
jgi:hypothetical protein